MGSGISTNIVGIITKNTYRYRFDAKYLNFLNTNEIINRLHI